MKFTKAQIAACQRELERTSGRNWVACDAVPEAAWWAFEKIGHGCGGDDMFRESGLNKIAGDEVAIAAAWCLALAQ